MPMPITSFKFILMPILEQRPKPAKYYIYAKMQHNMHKCSIKCTCSFKCGLEVASARVMIEILFVRGQKTYSMRAILDACALRAACAVGTLSDDPSLGEAVIDAFWPDWPRTAP